MRKLLVRGTLAVLAVCACAIGAYSATRTTYNDVVERYGVTPTDLASDLVAIERVVLASIPQGTSLSAARDTLRSWGLAEAEPSSIGPTRRFSHWVTDGDYGQKESEFLFIDEPFTDPPLEIRVFCDRPKISVSLGFKDGGLLDVEASSNINLRACI